MMPTTDKNTLPIASGPAPTLRMRRLGGALLILAAVASLPASAGEIDDAVAAAQAVPGWQAPMNRAPADRAPADYRITPGDELALKFFYVPELNETVTVRPDGSINLTLVGEIEAAELTPEQLAQRLSAAYASHLRHPDVAVKIEKGFGRQQVFVGGEVEHPGVQPLLPSLTLMRALIVAQGMKETAAPKRVLILRRDATGASQVIEADVARQMRGDGGVDPVLQPYDVVLVPPSRISRVNRWIDLYIRRNLPVGFSYDLNNRRGY